MCNSSDPMDCSPPGFSVHRILQARILEWVAISFSMGLFPPRNWTQVSCIAGRRFADWAMRESHTLNNDHIFWATNTQGFPGGSAGKESTCNEGGLGLIPGLERSPGGGNGYPAPVFRPGEFMDSIVHGVTKSWTWLNDFHFHLFFPGG